MHRLISFVRGTIAAQGLFALAVFAALILVLGLVVLAVFDALTAAAIIALLIVALVGPFVVHYVLDVAIAKANEPPRR